jgi:hypothetical protein
VAATLAVMVLPPAVAPVGPAEVARALLAVVARPDVGWPAGEPLTVVAYAPLLEELSFRHLPTLACFGAPAARGAPVLPHTLVRRPWAMLALVQVTFALAHVPRICAAARELTGDGGMGACAAAALPTVADLALAGGALVAMAVATRALTPLVAVHATANLLVLALGPALPRTAWRSALCAAAAVAIVWSRRPPAPTPGRSRPP